ncbi:MAG: outer membrane beta-barrel family protein [Bacteroidota bacterium]
MKALHLLLASLLSCSLLAQLSVSGTVRDAGGTPLPFANARLFTLPDTSFAKGGTTDLEGKYQLTVPESGTFLLRIDYLGYQSRDTAINVTTELVLPPVYLVAAGKDLATITVTADQPVVEQRADKLWFNVATSPLKTGYDALEVLERSPNVWITDDGQVLLRNEAAQVFINGRPLRLTGEARTSYLRSINSDNLLRIEITPNAGADQAAEGAGGTVNLILKRPIRGTNGSAQAHYMHRGPASRALGSGLNLNYGGNKWNVYGGYDYATNLRSFTETATTDYFTTGNFLTNEQIGRDSFYRHNARAGFVAEVHPRHVFGGEFFRNSSDFLFRQDNDVLLTAAGQLREDGTNTFLGFRDHAFTNATLNYSWTLDTLGASLKLFGDHAAARSRWFNTTNSVYETGTIADNQDRNTTDNFTRINDLQADLVTPLKNGIKLTTGLKWTATVRDNSLLAESLAGSDWVVNDRSSGFDYQEDITAAYATASRQLTEKTFLKVGLRAERTQLRKTDLTDQGVIEQDYVNWFPSFFLSRKLTAVTTLSLTYSKRLRRPPFSFLNDNVRKINDFRFELGNPDLAPEFRHRYELTATVGQHQFALFYHNTVDAINGIYFLEGEVAFYQRFNAGRQTQYGLEYNRAADVLPWWYLQARVQLFSRQFINEEGEQSFQQTTFRVRATNTFKLSDRTRLEVRGTYYGPQADAFYIRRPIYEFDAMVQRQFFAKQLTVRLHVRDLLRTLQFANERPFATFATTTERRPFTRTVDLRVTYRFSASEGVSNRRNRSQNGAARRI